MQEEKNPYLAQETEGSVGEAPVQEISGTEDPMQEKAPKKPPFKVIIPVAAIAAALVIGMVAAVFLGIFTDEKKEIERAFTAVFQESGSYLGEVFDFKQYTGMFQDDAYTADMQLTLPEGIEIGMMLQQNKEASAAEVTLSVLGMMEIGAESYLDDSELVLALPELTDDLFTVNRQTLEEDVQKLVDRGLLDEETAEAFRTLNKGETENAEISEEALTKLGRDVGNACRAFYEGIEVAGGEEQTVTVDGSKVQAKGYVLTTNLARVADWVEDIKNAYQSNEEVSAAYQTICQLYGETADSVEERYAQIEQDLAEIREHGEEEIGLEVYLYEGRLARVFMKDISSDTYVQWDIEGGSFPLENTSLTIGDSMTSQSLSRSGSREEDGTYYAKYSLIDQYNEYMLELSYTLKDGSFSLESRDKVYDYSEFYLEGSLEKTDADTVTLAIDTLEIGEQEILSGEIILSDECGEIVRPEGGEERNILTMSEEEWEEVLLEIAGALFY